MLFNAQTKYWISKCKHNSFDFYIFSTFQAMRVCCFYNF